MDSKQSSKYCVNEMVPLGTSKETLILEITSKTKQPPADPDFVPVRFCVRFYVKILLATLVIAVVIVTVFVGIFVSQRIKNKVKGESQRK